VSGRKVPASLADNTGESLLHIALRLLDETAANALRQRLHSAQISITEIPEWARLSFRTTMAFSWQQRGPEQLLRRKQTLDHLWIAQN
jgi:hypothetical protein